VATFILTLDALTCALKQKISLQRWNDINALANMPLSPTA
jgi:hypothetical protein